MSGCKAAAGHNWEQNRLVKWGTKMVWRLAVAVAAVHPAKGRVPFGWRIYTINEHIVSHRIWALADAKNSSVGGRELRGPVRWSVSSVPTGFIKSIEQTTKCRLCWIFFRICIWWA